jgi:hypothetical protein
MKAHLPLTAAVLGLLAAACGGRPATDAGPPPGPPPGADEVVVRVSALPGLLPPGGAAAIPPSYSLYGDGRLISAQPGPGPLPDLVEHSLSPDAVRGVRQAALAATGSGSAGAGPDSPVVVVRVGPTAPRTLPRATAGDLLRDLGQLTAGAGRAYRPTGVAVIATPTPGTPTPGTQTSGTGTRDWTLSALTGRPLGGTAAGARCTVLPAARLPAARRAVAGTTAATVWSAAGRTWALAFRPLLPDEPDCASLGP